SGAFRMGRAIVAGFVAAIAGALLWWGVRKITGYEVGLISIAIGVGVGKAVRWGSRSRGGWAYQLLAILLTYGAVAGNYMPDAYQAIREQGEKQASSPKSSAPNTVTKASAVPPANDGMSIGGLL